MQDDVKRVREKIERYRRLLSHNRDEAAGHAIRDLLRDAEDELKAITDSTERP